MSPRRPGVRGAAGLWGIGAAAVYLATALFALPAGRPAILFDGLAPPPRYNWVRPPEPLARGNVAPSPARGSLSIIQSVDASGVPIAVPKSQSGSVGTPDGQATILFEQDAFVVRPGDASVDVTLTPDDAEERGPSPTDLRFDGNAYRVEAQLLPSSRTAELRKQATMYLRYASGATSLLRLEGNEWRSVASVHYPGSNALTAEISVLGVFVAAAPRDLPYVHSTPWWAYVVVIALLLPPVVILTWVVLTARKSRSRRPPTDRFPRTIAGPR